MINARIGNSIPAGTSARQQEPESGSPHWHRIMYGRDHRRVGRMSAQVASQLSNLGTNVLTISPGSGRRGSGVA